MLSMHPGPHMSPAQCSFALGDLVLVVGENVVDTAGVEVDLLAEKARNDRRALDMPAREAFAPGTAPFQRAARLSGFPEREVPLVALVRVRDDPPALGDLLGP